MSPCGLESPKEKCAVPSQELSFRMPLHLYADKSFVVWGNHDYLVAGDQRHGEQLWQLASLAPHQE